MNDYFEKKDWEKARMGFEYGGMNTNHRMGMRVCFAVADLLTEITQPRSILLKADLKSEKSQTDKLKREYKGDMSLMKDLVRTTLLTMTDEAYDVVARFFVHIKTDKTFLNNKIKQYYNQSYYKDGVFRDLSKDERDQLLSGDWEVMPGSWKLKDPIEFSGYSDTTVVLQYDNRHSVGGLDPNRKAPNRWVGPGPALWAVQSLRVEIQANVPEMIYGKQVKETFLEMIPGTFGEDLYTSMRNKMQILGGLGHIFYEVIREKVPVDGNTKALSKRYYDYIRNPSPRSKEWMDLCKELADYVDKNRKTLELKEIEHLPGPTTTLSEISCEADDDKPIIPKGNTKAKAAMFNRLQR